MCFCQALAKISHGTFVGVRESLRLYQTLLVFCIGLVSREKPNQSERLRAISYQVSRKVEAGYNP